VTPNKDFGPQFEETVYISEVNGAMKVQSNAQVAMNKISDPVQKLFPYGKAGKDSAPNSNISKLLELPKKSRARKLIFGLHVNMDKGSSRRCDVTQ